MKQYKIVFFQQLSLLSPCLLRYSILGGIYLYAFRFTLPYPALLFVFLVPFSLDILPTIIVHIQYLLKNWGASFTIDTNKKMLYYKAKDIDLKISFDDITGVQAVFSYGRRTGKFSFSRYRFYRIIYNGNNELIVTCALVDNIENNLGELLPLKADTKFMVIAFLY